MYQQASKKFVASTPGAWFALFLFKATVLPRIRIWQIAVVEKMVQIYFRFQSLISSSPEQVIDLATISASVGCYKTFFDEI